MKSEAVAWLKFFRAHTAILEMPIAVLGAAMAIGTVFDIRVAGWALFGALYHFCGYGMNSYVDWKKGFDKDDPNKEDHPLNTGDISEKYAKYATVSSLILLIIVGEILAGFSIIAHAFVVIMFILGAAYNFFGKYTNLKFIPISIVHSMVFLFPYMVYSDNISVPAALVFVTFIVHHTFQIAISGDIKDLKQDEASLIKTLGARVRVMPDSTNMMSVGFVVHIIAYTLTLAQVILSITARYMKGGEWVSVVAAIPFSMWLIYESDKVVYDGPYMRESRVLAMSRREMAGIWLMCVSAIPYIGKWSVVLIIGGSLAYFLPISRLMWGNWVKPEV